MYAAILAGGVGTRLWPRSRQSQPKQFSDIVGSGRTMIQATADRIAGLVAPNDLYVVTGLPYAALAAEQLPEVPTTQIIAEPSGRNTGPAIGLACVHIRQRNPQAVVAFLHSDHVVLDPAAFRAALQQAEPAAQAGYIVTLGIEPTFAHTGYGYIKRGIPLEGLSQDSSTVYSVEQFLEKPDRTTAESFLEEGGYYWNGGIFVCRVDVMLEEFSRQLPELAAGLARIDAALARSRDAADPIFHATFNEVWPTLPSISIDHGIMEHAQNVATVPLDAGWNDVGSWDALEAILEQDESRNFVAKGGLLPLESHGNIVYTDKEVVALIGVENLVVVDTGDTLLIGDKQQMQKVKDVVEYLRSQGRSELL
ncbi:MAG: mannose-1-phosphate guanylyltransferase [Caldilineaceae bacterium]|nr:mannose-1-phosphate guanylyltransferase [Caldilineaceae bacterium]